MSTPEAPPGSAFVLTGISASGKSTVGELLARRLPRSAHVHGDIFRRWVVNGREEMTSPPTAGAVSQLRLRHELAASVVDGYAAAGFRVVLQDVFLGEFLPFVVDAIRTRPICVIVLCPAAEVVRARETARAKQAYSKRSNTIEQLHLVGTQETPRIGRWLDTSALDAEATVDKILRDLNAALVVE